MSNTNQKAKAKKLTDKELKQKKGGAIVVPNLNTSCGPAPGSGIPVAVKVVLTR